MAHTPPLVQPGGAQGAQNQARDREESYLKLGFFSGTEDPAAVRAFLAKLAGIQQAGRYSDEALAGMVKFSVRGAAARWLDNLLQVTPDVCDTWVNLQPVFKARWLRKPTGSQVVAQRENTKQKTGQGVEEFFDVVESSVLKSHETMTDAVRQSATYPDFYKHAVVQEFVAGLKPVIQSKVSIHNPLLPADALRHAIAAEDALTEEERRVYRRKDDKSGKTVDSVDVSMDCDDDDTVKAITEKVVEALRFSQRGGGKGRGGGRGRGGQGGGSSGRPGSQATGQQSSGSSQGGGGRGGGGPRTGPLPRNMTCYGCGDTNHMLRDCPTYNSFSQYRTQMQQRVQHVQALENQAAPHVQDGSPVVHHPFQ